MAEFDNRNIFMRGELASGDYNFMFWIVLLIGISLTLSIIEPSNDAARIYKDLGFFTLILLGFAVVGMRFVKQLPFAGVFISQGNFFVSVGAGLAISFALIGSDLFGFKALIGSLSVPTFSIIQAGTLASVFMISLYVSEIEETFRASILTPSLINTISQWGYSLTLILLGVLLYFVFASQTFGVIAAVVGVALFFYKKFNLRSIKLLTYGTGVVFAGIMFASLHFLAYNASSAQLVAAFLFAVIADTVNILLGNTIASRVAHTVNNGVVASIAVGLPAFLGLMVGGVHIGLLYVLRETKVRAV